MNRGYRAIVIGVGLLLSSIVLDLIGSSLQSLGILILSFALGIAGAVVAVRGLIEFIAERS